MREDLLDWLEARLAGTVPPADLLSVAPGLSITDAYRLQAALMRRRAARGDRIVGYKAAFTSVAMQKMYNVSAPIIGTLLASGCLDEAAPIPLEPGGVTKVEPEVLALLKRDLVGPKIGIGDVVGALDGFLPAIEVAPPIMGGIDRSVQMGIAQSKLTGGIVVGSRLTAPEGLDLRLEGCVISINGEPKGSNTAVEVLGNPLTVIALIANQLAEIGERLSAGMMIMTGSVVPAVPVAAGDEVLVEFTHLGSVRARF